MTQITANLVKELREKTGVGMMDCKKALVESNGDFQAAIDWLRTKGHASAAKRSERIAAEGLVALEIQGNKAAIIELNSETDFVARNEKFQDLIHNLLKIAFDCKSLNDLENAEYPKTKRSVKDEILENMAVIGEKINLNRFDTISVNEGLIVSYIHNEIVPGAGKIAVLIALESKANKEKLNALGKQLAMHIAAAKPEALNVEDVSTENLDREKQIFTDQARASGKPDNIIEKMVGGRISKYYQEVVLLEQVFVIDNKTKISALLADFAKENGTTVAIKGFIRYELGERISKTEE
jgi:elongation factor Ts